jgi:hypothetical protein
MSNQLAPVAEAFDRLDDDEMRRVSEAFDIVLKFLDSIPE